MTISSDKKPPSLAARVRAVWLCAISKDPIKNVTEYMDGLDIETQRKILLSPQTAWLLVRKMGFFWFAELVKKHPQETQQKIIAKYLTRNGIEEKNDSEAFKRAQESTFKEIQRHWTPRRYATNTPLQQKLYENVP
jgi:hypothetical protein